jgi:hypothetical protein
LAPSRISSPRRLARAAALAGAATIALGLAACGSSSDSGSASTTSTNGQQANGQRNIFSDPKVQSCLKKQGVDVSQFRRGKGQGGPPPDGQGGPPPTDTNGQPPSGQGGPPPTDTNGQPPNGGGFGNSAQAQKLRKAMEKCGVKLPSGPRQQQSTTPSDTNNS